MVLSLASLYSFFIWQLPKASLGCLIGTTNLIKLNQHFLAGQWTGTDDLEVPALKELIKKKKKKQIQK